MRRFLLTALLATPLAAGCVPPPAPPGPSVPPGGPIGPSGLGTTPWLSYAGVELRGGSLDWHLTADGAPVEGALVKLYGPTLAAVETDAAGKAAFTGLAPGAYRVVAEAAGRQTTEWTNVTISVGKRFEAEPQALAPGASLQGVVQNEAGAPLAGVVVSDGLASTVSGEGGAFTLAGLKPGAVTISANKPGYARSEREVAVAAGGPATLTWRLSPAAKTLLLDTSLATSPPAFSQARAALSAAGFTLVERLDQAPAVWVLVRPTGALDPARAGAVRAFVAQGGSLVVLGEWGGSGAFRADRTDAYLHPLGVHLNRDLVRFGTADGGAANRLAPGHPALAGLSGLQVERACSVFALPPLTALVAPATGAYRVQQAEGSAEPPFAVAAGGPAGAGKVLAIGDASAFSDEDADGNGVSNFQTADNAKAWVQLLSF